MARFKIIICNVWAAGFLVAANLVAEPGPARSSDATGLLWTSSMTGPKASLKAKVERELTDQFENELGRRLIKDPNRNPIPPETFRLAKLRQKASDLNNQLIRLVFDRTLPASAFESEVKQMIGELNKVTSQLPRGTFGPEIQLSRMVQAVWLWRVKNLKGFYRLYREARDLHPLREVDFEKFNDEPLASILENEFHRLDKNQHVPTCSLKKIDHLFEIGNPTWINGFKIETPGIEIFPGNYFVVRRDEKGNIFEKLLRCGEAKQSWGSGEWVPLKSKLRIEHLIPSELDRIKDLVILSKEEGGIRKYSFSSSTGLREWQPETFETDLKVPIQHSFPMDSDEKWYNKTNIWWLAGAVLATGAILMAQRGSGAAQAVTLKLGGVP